MLNMNYINSTLKYAVNFKTITSNIIEIKGDFPIQTDGIQISRDKKPDDVWDYSDYTTIYREIEGGVQFSNDGSVYAEPEPIPEPEPYIPTLEEMKATKLIEIQSAKQLVVSQGFNTTVTEGTTEHFDLEGDNMTFLTALQTQVLAGVNQIPWHVSDESIPCKFYSNENMGIITTTAMNITAYHVTYLKDLTRYINNITSEEKLHKVYYGMDIPTEYQSDPLKAMIAGMGA